MSSNIIYYYYVAAVLWVITSGPTASTTISVLLSALRNMYWDLLLIVY